MGDQQKRIAIRGRAHHRLGRAWDDDTEGLEPGAEETLRAERERLRHVTELAEGVAAAGEALAPEEGEGASGLIAVADPIKATAREAMIASSSTRLRVRNSPARSMR